MPSKQRPSGGARAAAKKHQVQADARGGRYNAQAIAQFKRVMRGKRGAAGALDEGLEVLRVAMRQAAIDPGMAPEYRREQAARFALYLTKAAEPKKLIDEQGADLRAARADIFELEGRIAEMEGRPSAPQEHPRDPGGAPTPPLQ